MNIELFSTGLHIGKIVITSPAVQGVVSTLITTVFVRRGENIKAMEAFKSREFEKVANELLSEGKLSYVELYKCRNFLKVAKRAGLKLYDIAAYDNGVYAELASRKEPCFIPEDVFVILGQYIAQRQEHDHLFYNSRGNKLNTMYISRLMKKYTELAGVPNYSAEALRNTCAVTMFAYEASPEQAARQMGVTQIQIKRYKNLSYRDNLVRAANELVKVRVEPPK